jgi:hypothetical protein
MADRRQATTVTALLDQQGRTFSADAGITLADKPAPLYQLLVLATLLSTRISARIAVDAARELFTAGYRTAAAMGAASWQDRVDALGRGHYRRYDERTATMLGDGAELCQHGGAATCGGCTPRPVTTRPRCAGRSPRSPASARPVRTSSCGRCRRYGRDCGRTWTGG